MTHDVNVHRATARHNHLPTGSPTSTRPLRFHNARSLARIGSCAYLFFAFLFREKERRRRTRCAAQPPAARLSEEACSSARFSPNPLRALQETGRNFVPLPRLAIFTAAVAKGTPPFVPQQETRARAAREWCAHRARSPRCRPRGGGIDIRRRPHRNWHCIKCCSQWSRLLRGRAGSGGPPRRTARDVQLATKCAAAMPRAVNKDKKKKGRRAKDNEDDDARVEVRCLARCVPSRAPHASVHILASALKRPTGARCCLLKPCLLAPCPRPCPMPLRLPRRPAKLARACSTRNTARIPSSKPICGKRRALSTAAGREALGPPRGCRAAAEFCTRQKMAGARGARCTVPHEPRPDNFPQRARAWQVYPAAVVRRGHAAHRSARCRRGRRRGTRAPGCAGQAAHHGRTGRGAACNAQGHPRRAAGRLPLRFTRHQDWAGVLAVPGVLPHGGIVRGPPADAPVGRGAQRGDGGERPPYGN